MDNVHEEWRPVVGYEGRYEVSSLGRVRSLPRTAVRSDGHVRAQKGTILQPGANPDSDYLNVNLYRQGGRAATRYRVHRLVARSFLGEPEIGQQVNHKDLDKQNNAVANLEWVTARENTLHALAEGRRGGHGERHACAKLTRNGVREIRGLYPGVSVACIAEKFGLHIRTIYKVIRRDTWRHVE